MREHTNQFSLNKMAKLMKVSRSGYYAYLKRDLSKRSKENIELIKEIKSIYSKNRGLYGSPRIHAALMQRDINCSRKRVANLMRKCNLRAKMNRSFKHRKKIKKQVAPNLLKQNFYTESPNHVWVSDISYIKTLEGWLYLATTMDLFSRKIIGVSMDSHMNVDLVEKALMSAVYRRSPKGEIIHHSDRGSQYTSSSFKQLCELHSIKLSMSEGSCYDNAAMESFFHTLKTELVHLNKFSTRQEAKRAIFEYIEGFYNRKRLHSTLGYLSPEAFEDLYKEKQRICS